MPDKSSLAQQTALHNQYADRLWRRVNKTDTCWLWTGPATKQGYGQLSIGGRITSAHRFAYEIAYGPIPAGLSCCHHCDTPLCVRPDHLFTGTAADNARDRDAKGRGFRHLSDDDIRAIRVARLEGATTVELARRYSVHQSHISRVALYRRNQAVLQQVKEVAS